MSELETRTALDAAQMLMAAHSEGRPFQPFADAWGIASPKDAYDVQNAYVRRLKETRNARAAGYKVGLTSARMQAMCKIDSPIAGVVLDDRVHASGVRLARSRYGRLGLEFEIAVRMKRDLSGDGAAPSLSQVAEAVDAVCPAIEVVDDRGCDYRALDVLSLIADNSWNAGVVLGAFGGVWPDLAEIEGVVTTGGVEIDRGFGRDVLEHPFHSVAWLAQHLARGGNGLRAGDIVMTGSIVTTKFPTEPCSYRFELKGLGSLDVTVE